MKKSEAHLFNHVAKLLIKYADIDAADMKQHITNHLRQQIENASTNTHSSGIMPFLDMLQEDGASLAINVKRDGDKVTVSFPSVNPEATAYRYAALPFQIKTYLQRNLEIFPTVRNGEDIEYDNITFTLNY